MAAINRGFMFKTRVKPGDKLDLETSTGDRIVISYLGPQGRGKNPMLSVDADKSITIKKVEENEIND